MIDLKLETYLKLCQTRNYTQTAKLLNITQPAVTQHIKHLESQYQTKLFYFDGKRRLQLTANGKLLRDFTQNSKAQSEKIAEQLSEPLIAPDEIKIGSLVTTGESLVPHMVAEYLRRYPDKKVSVYLDEADALLIQLQNGRIHFCVTDIYCPLDQYESREIFESETICVCSPSHPLAGKTADFSTLNDYRLVFRENDTYSKRNLMKILDTHHQDINNFQSYVEIGTINAVKKMVMENIGISFIYRFVVQDDLDNGTLAEIHINHFFSRHLFRLAWMKNSLLTPSSLQFWGVCEEAAAMQRGAWHSLDSNVTAPPHQDGTPRVHPLHPA